MEMSREPEQRDSAPRQPEGQRGESLEPQAPTGAREAVALPVPSQPGPGSSPASHYSRFDYRLAKDFLKDGSLLWSTESPTAATRFHLLPGGSVWRERESLLDAPEHTYSLESVKIEALVEDGPAGVVLALRERGILPPAVHSDKWFDAAFEGMELPERLRSLSERLCRAYGIGGTADPAHIANLVARQLGLGDGRGQFYTASHGVPAWHVDGIEKMPLRDALGHLNDVMIEAGYDTLTARVADHWTCSTYADWRSFVKTGSNEGFYVHLEAVYPTSGEGMKEGTIADVKVLGSFDEALRMSNLISSWLQAQGL